MKRQCAGLVWRAMPKVERAKDQRTGKRQFDILAPNNIKLPREYVRQCTKMQEAEMCATHSGFYVRSR